MTRGSNVHFRIGNRLVGPGYPAYIIAEVGSNHGGNLETAKALIDGCVWAGVNAVKFQSWTAEKLNNRFELSEDGTLMPSKVIDILRRYEMPTEWHSILYEYCRDRSVDFLSTPFDVDRACLLRDIGVPAIKISSSDLNYVELLKEVSGFGIPVLLSTGMATLGEVETAVAITRRSGNPVGLFHCTAAYPPAIEDANLRAIVTMTEKFDVPVGVSDHYLGHDTVIAAIALGACIVEKHVTLSRDAGTPDAPFALEIEEFAAMVKAVREIESALGDGDKYCRSSERGGLKYGRRGLHASRKLAAGEKLTREMLAVVRPNIGDFDAPALDKVLGTRILCDVPEGMPLRATDIAI